MPVALANAGEAALVEGVTCAFGKRKALDGLSLKVPAGSVMGIVGPNGAGKTTLLDVICGLLTPTAGRVRVLGLDVASSAREVARRIGVVPQETALYDDLSAGENLQFAASLYGLTNPGERVTAVLQLVGLADRAQERAGVLSGGMRRRLCVARALLHEPALLVLDEPTVGVDAEARHQIWSHVRTLRREGRTVLLSTNYLDEAEALCDRVAILREGRLFVEDAPDALLRRTGRCIDLDCPSDSAQRLAEALAAEPKVLRAQRSATGGVTVYLEGGGDVDQLVQQAMRVVPLDGFRARSPDLAEVFSALSSRAPDAR